MDVTVTFPISFRYDGTWRCKDVRKPEKQMTEDISQYTELYNKNILTVLNGAKKCRSNLLWVWVIKNLMSVIFFCQ